MSSWSTSDQTQPISMESSRFGSSSKNDQFNSLGRRYNLEAQIRATKQGNRTIQEFHKIMVGLWDQLAKIEPPSGYHKGGEGEEEEQHRLVQFLMGLRDEFETTRRSILCRSDYVLSVEEAVRELVREEKTRLMKTSIVCSKSKEDDAESIDDLKIIRNQSSNKNFWLESSSSSSSSFGGRRSSPFFPDESNSEPFKGLLSDDFVKMAKATVEAVKVSRAVYNFFTHPGTDPKKLKILSYNVWFRHVELDERMEALGGLIHSHSPDVICLQEVNSDIYDIFEQSSWWSTYRCSVSHDMSQSRPYFCMQLSKLPVKCFSTKPFSNSVMGRELCLAEVQVGTKTLLVATTHLESPQPERCQMFSEQRVAQAKLALQNFLRDHPNVIFCGDMNWDDEQDGPFPLQPGWFDAWTRLRPTENGWTFDTKSNPMLSANYPLQKRLDRFVCKLEDFNALGIEMIGTKAIPGVSYCKEKKVKNRIKTLTLPVLPSDHYGLLLDIQSQ